jgi:hypothetical protein
MQFHVMEASAMMSPGKALAALPVCSFIHVDRLLGGRGAATSAVSPAHARGELLRLRNGLYYKGVKTRYGLTGPKAEETAIEVSGRAGVGPTGYSAARALGLTTQVPARPSLTVAGPVPTGLPGVEVSRRNDMRRRELGYVEVAVLELLRGDWELIAEDGWPAFPYSTRFGSAAVTEGVLLEMGSRGGTYPTERHELRSMLANFAIEQLNESPDAWGSSRR